MEGDMILKLIVLRCPTCGAHVDVKEGSRKAVCEYCDTPFYVEENELRGEEQAAADIPQGKEPEGTEEEDQDQAYADLAYELSRRDIEERTYLRKQKKWQTSLVVFAVVAVIAILAHNPAFLCIVLIVGFIVIIAGRPKHIYRRGGPQYYETDPCSDKSQIAALLLCIVFGLLGAHYFYVGKIGKGILFLLTVGLFGIGWLIDIIRIACGAFRDSKGLPLRG